MGGQEQSNSTDSAGTEPGGSTCAAFSHIAQMHLDELANLWTVWRAALELPQHDAASISEIEIRMQAHIVGMRLHEQTVWHLCTADLSIADAGELFAATQLAFRSYDVEKIKLVVEAAGESLHAIDGVISALAWMPADITDSWIEKFLESKDFLHKYIAVEAERWQGRVNQRRVLEFLSRPECMDFTLLGSAVLRCIGEFKIKEAESLISPYLQGDLRFWALYAQVMLGDKANVGDLREFLIGDELEQKLALQLAFRLLELSQAQTWISSLAENPATIAVAIQATGILGDPQAIPWLIGLMQRAETAKLAGFAFAMITGCEIEANEYHMDSPPESLNETVARELASESPASAFEEALPWPNAGVIWQAWQDHLGHKFSRPMRYFLGEAINGEFCRRVAESGFQPERMYAVYELALKNPAYQLYNTQGIQHPER